MSNLVKDILSHHGKDLSLNKIVEYQGKVKQALKNNTLSYDKRKKLEQSKRYLSSKATKKRKKMKEIFNSINSIRTPKK